MSAAPAVTMQDLELEHAEATSSEALVLVIAVTQLEMLGQLVPFARFDRYFILSDLAGVPDLFTRVTPMATVGAAGAGVVPLSLAGSLCLATGVARRLAAAGLSWAAGCTARPRLAAVAALAALAAFWVTVP